MSEMESLLLAQDDLIKRFRKTEIGSIQANVAQGGDIQDQNSGMQSRNKWERVVLDRRLCRVICGMRLVVGEIEGLCLEVDSVIGNSWE